MLGLLGIMPSNPREGCGQDVHIPCGTIDYKPDYLISRMALAQLAAAASLNRPDMEWEFADGDFAKAVHPRRLATRKRAKQGFATDLRRPACPSHRREAE
jgi:Zn-dependent M32 family carboxypeptidase